MPGDFFPICVVREITWLVCVPQQAMLFMCLFTAPLLTGCAATYPLTITAKPVQYQAEPATIFIVDGAGNYQMTSKAIRNVLVTDGYPFDALTYDWSHGHHRVLADQMDSVHARRQGKELAEKLLVYHDANPERPLYLIGHSAGSMVVMAALEALPANVVDRAILLSPSLSTYYDVQPALAAVKKSLHVFYSRHDLFLLGFAIHIVGTSDRQWTMSAGRVGFAADDPKLVQVPWRPSDRELGNDGGHYGTYQPDYLRAQIVPLFNPRP